ncbi:hypothetical protein SAMN05444672_1744 [Bacillus sp. OK838]|nr:hypothetical protein SAMN05444672_1744 [Bacillus sp. OK838]
MELTLFAISLRGRKAYKDETGNLYLECTSCKAIKKSYEFTNAKHGFLGKRHNCSVCKYENNKEYNTKEYMRRWRRKRAMAKYS